jgi:histidinol dehydrogenase
MRILAGKAAERCVCKLAGRGSRNGDVEPVVHRIVDDVRRRGDRALRKYAERWDGLSHGVPLRVSEKEIEAAWKSASTELKKSLRAAAGNIRTYCEAQKPQEWRRTVEGVTVGQIVRPVESVGCYVPGGRYPLASTLLMTAIPAQVATVPRICVVTPQPRHEVLAAAAMLGIAEVYSIGGGQAIAALAYGTESIPRVDKIVGPGNVYVTAAKKLVAFDCAIDFLAGPTEVVIVSDAGTPEFIAADLVAQAEHDPDALAVFITTRRRLADSVARCMDALSRSNPVARQSLRRSGVILQSASRRQSFDWANELAPEHITVDPPDLELVRNAGSVFLGGYSPQAAGDYASGPNHVLPTGGGARFRGGLSVSDFMKVISVQQLSRKGLKRLAPTIELLARTEGLRAHAESILARCNHA